MKKAAVILVLCVMAFMLSGCLFAKKQAEAVAVSDAVTAEAVPEEVK